MTITYVDLPGSVRPPRRDAFRVGLADADETVKITVSVRRRQPEFMVRDRAPTAYELEEYFGSNPADVERAARTLERLGLTITDRWPGAALISAEGTVAQIKSVFDVELARYRAPDQYEYRGREGVIRIPAELNGIVTGVFGLDARRIEPTTGDEPTGWAGVQGLEKKSPVGLL